MGYTSLINDLTVFVDSFGKTQGGYSKVADLGRAIGSGNRLESIPQELSVYEPYLKAVGKNITWLKWQEQGQEYMDITEKCPFCVSEPSIPKEVIQRVSHEYDVKYLSAVNKILDVFLSLDSYFSEFTRETMQHIRSNTLGINTEEKNFLLRLKDEAISLLDKLNRLKNIGYFTLSDVNVIADELREYTVDISLYPQLNGEKTVQKLDSINYSLEEVISRARILQGLIEIQKRDIKNTIELYETSIDEFLESAGYPYRVSIIRSTENSYHMILSYLGFEDSLTNVKDCLSYGERNAFALVLFMYQSLNENADLVILDDPISSFDTNKKYAIMSKLFRGKQTLQGKTVVLLTHDFEPIIDTIYTLRDKFSPIPNAYYIASNNGILTEKIITKHDIHSCVSICERNIRNSTDIIHQLIFYRRLIEINNQKGEAWDLLSNLFHKDREKPIKREGDQDPREMTRDEVDRATIEISKNIIGF